MRVGIILPLSINLTIWVETSFNSLSLVGCQKNLKTIQVQIFEATDLEIITKWARLLLAHLWFIKFGPLSNVTIHL